MYFNAWKSEWNQELMNAEHMRFLRILGKDSHLGICLGSPHTVHSVTAHVTFSNYLFVGGHRESTDAHVERRSMCCSIAKTIEAESYLLRNVRVIGSE